MAAAEHADGIATIALSHVGRRYRLGCDIISFVVRTKRRWVFGGALLVVALLGGGLWRPH